MAAVLVSLLQAKAQLRITTAALDPGDVEIQLKLDQAEALVLERVNTTVYWRAIAVTWTASTVPPGVQAGILTLLVHLYEHRGDNMTPDDAVWAAVDRQIGGNRDPVLA